MKVRKMRLLRLKYKISCPELGKTIGLSPQRISEIELSSTGIEKATQMKIHSAFLKVIENRRAELFNLTEDFLSHEGSLTAMVEEHSYEL